MRGSPCRLKTSAHLSLFRQAEKKRGRRNAEIMQLINLVTLAVHVVYGAVRYWWFNASFSRLVACVYLVLAVMNAFVVYLLNKWSVDVDLTDPGLVEYMRDSVYFSWIILVLSLLTDYALLLIIVIPIFVAYKLMGAMGGGGLGAGLDPTAGGMPDDGRVKKRKVPKQTLSKSERREKMGIDYRGGRPKFNK